MSANLRNARKALRAAATCLRQSAALDTLDAHTRSLVLLQATHIEAEANTVSRRLIDEAEHRQAVRKAVAS